MSGSGFANNSYLYGGADGNAVSASEGGNLHTQIGVDKIKNIGRYVLRSSGARRLPDLAASWVMISSKEGNGNIWIAGYDIDAPTAGMGIPLYEGNYITLPCENLNQWSLIPEIDGDEVYIVAALSGTDITITPSNPNPLDKIRPTILSNVPTAGATGILRSTTVTITASEELDSNTVDETTVTLKRTSDNTIIPTTVSLDSANPAVIIIRPNTSLASSTSHTATVTTAIKDPTGNALLNPYSFAFTTGTLIVNDTTAPTISSHTPTQNATSVSVSVAPTVLFSEAMMLSSFTTTSVQLQLAANNQVVTGTSYTLSTDLKTLNIGMPALENSKSYKIVIFGGTNDVKDLAGNAMVAATYTINFSTVSSTLKTVYSVGGDSYDSLYAGSITETSLKLAGTASILNDKIPKMIKLTLKKFGSPTGNYEIIWHDLSLGNYVVYKTLYTGSASALLTTDTIITVDMSTNTDDFESKDRITVKYTGGSSASGIMVKKSNSDVADGVNTHRAYVIGTTLTDVTSTDLAMTIQTA